MAEPEVSQKEDIKVHCFESSLYSMTAGSLDEAERPELAEMYKMNQPGVQYIHSCWIRSTLLRPKKFTFCLWFKGAVQIIPQRQAAVAPVGTPVRLPGPQSFVIGCQSFRGDFIDASPTRLGLSMLVLNDFDKYLGRPEPDSEEVARE